MLLLNMLLYSMVVMRRTYAAIYVYSPRAPISIYTGVCGTLGLDVFRDRKRSLLIEHVYTYIP